MALRATTGFAATFLLAACGSGGSGSVGPPPPGEILDCPAADTLELLVACITDQMPQENSDAYVVPSAAEFSAWRTVTNRMLSGECDFTLPASLAGAFRVETFSDTAINREYCVLREVGDADGDGFTDLGWGAFVVYAAAEREISHQAPHPVADFTTESQAVTLFKQTASRSFLMAGAHRRAAAAQSPCQAEFRASDAAHDDRTTFHASHLEMMTYYGGNAWHAIQWHGMAATTCATTEVYLSHGRDRTPAPRDTISVLRDELLALHPDWVVDVPGSGACTLHGTQNIQGRRLNGVPAASECATAAAAYTGQFIHVEQDPGFRAPGDWVDALLGTFP